MKAALRIAFPLLFTAALPLTAQEPVLFTLLPDSVAEHAVRIYNRDGTIRLNGESEIAAGTRVDGSVAVLNGPLRIAGSVGGDVVVINGDAQLSPGARISGRLLVIGGTVTQLEGARVDGGVHSYREPLRFRYQDGVIRYVPPQQERGLSTGHEWQFGRADLFVGASGSYNRVEGLPVALGPRLRLGHRNPTRLHAFAIYRTGAGLVPEFDELGYELGAEQQLGVAGLSVSAAAYSVVTPIEEWQVTDRESSLATFVLHRDYRDHYDNAGARVSLSLDRADLPLSAQLWYRYEDHAPVAPRDPWTLLYLHDDWRPEPMVGKGRIRSLGLEWRYDTRNDPQDPADGWLLQGALEQGVGGAIELPRAEIPGQPSARTGFSTGLVDLRRYARLNPYSLVGIRLLAAGSIDGKPLPPQRQHALGGEGSLPAFRLLQFDCGARDRTYAGPGGGDYYPYYGCDRVALMQLEYQASFPLARRLGDRIGLSSNFSNSVRWVAFVDAGRAWNETSAGRGSGSSDFSADAGIGVRVAGLGAYWALPLSGSDKRLNFFVRVGPRL